MAKGDAKRMQGQIDTQGRTAQSGLNRLNTNLYGANQNFMNNYNQGVSRNLGSYDDIMRNYQSMYDNMAGGGSWDPQFRGAVGGSLGTYGDFANTGGFSAQDLQDMRARGTAPIRAAYQSATDEVNRGMGLGGSSAMANRNAALAQMSRNQGYGAADAMTNVNAGIAQLVQQGKLAGAGGLGQVGIGAQGIQNEIDQLNNAARARALEGMTSLYGTTPGLANTFGNQVLQSGNQLIDAQNLQNQWGGQMMQGQYNKSLIPSNFQQAMGNIGSVVGLGSQIAGGFGGAFGGGGMGGAASRMGANVNRTPTGMLANYGNSNFRLGAPPPR